MKINVSIVSAFIRFILLVFIAASQLQVSAQVTIYQFRHVDQDKVGEFIKRETNYWSKVAQKAIDNKKLTFWALLEKVGGEDLASSPNFLFINSYPNVDTALSGSIWNAAAVFPDISMDKIETESLSTTQSIYFLHDEDWAQAETAKPDSDFKFVVMNYHNSSMPDSFITLEKMYWKPFIQSAMNKKQTKQQAWGNANVLTPTGGDMKFNTVSYDLFANLQDALMAWWDPKIVFPSKGLDLLNKIRKNTSSTAIYRIVKVVTGP